MFQPNKLSSAQSGGALVYVFIGVALFALLAFTFSKSFTGVPTSTMSVGEARVVASRMLAFSQSVHSGVQKLLLNGCSEMELELDNPNTTGDPNPNAPSDGSCTLFSPSGGKVKYASITQLGGHDTTNNDVWFHYNGDWFMTCHIMAVEGIGDDTKAELLLTASNVDKQVCIEIDKALGIPTPNDYPPRDAVSDLGGNYYPDNCFGTTGAGRIITTTGGELRGKSEGCYVNDVISGVDKFFFYKVIIPK